ncbi:hypothetical protein GTW25_11875 [Aliihoeflea aestuarii]|uniref:hypothetical protein n=1 Tax=Aliihoeflea aestuarii TaxID=453840 RepID=UPI0020939866|nr:hypothetical protein [Aliihoeflea aestuarii]MCO6391727.1 hypothetical protein [Aliihoeflea aestuarii]
MKKIPDGLSNLSELDELACSYDGKRADLLFGHGISLMFEHGHTTSVRQGALDAMADYYATFRDHINFYFPYGARRPQPDRRRRRRCIS